MIRRMFNIAAVLSLLEFGATVVLPVVGALHIVSVTFERGGRVWVVGFTRDHATVLAFFLSYHRLATRIGNGVARVSNPR